MCVAQWPEELDPQLEIPSSTGEGGTAQKSKVRRNEKTGVWSHQEGSADFLSPLGSNFSSMILEESMLGDSAVPPVKATQPAPGASANPELNNMYRLHGNVPQRVRQEVYKKFCKAKSGILVSAFSCRVLSCLVCLLSAQSITALALIPHNKLLIFVCQTICLSHARLVLHRCGCERFRSPEN
jgi:hypothetical protein